MSVSLKDASDAARRVVIRRAKRRKEMLVQALKGFQDGETSLTDANRELVMESLFRESEWLEEKIKKLESMQ